MNLMKTKGKSDTELIEFSVEDTSSIDKISISDPKNNRITLVRDGELWKAENGECINQQSVKFILETFKKIEFKGYVPDKSIDQFYKLMITQHTKVMIYQNGNWVKTWYIGPSSQDHYGQVMLLDDAKHGKSTYPVMMKIRGENGIIEPRFFADKRKWMCTNIFAVPMDQISSVSVKFNDKPFMSFLVKKSGNQVEVYQQDKKLNITNTSKVISYLQRYKKIHFELPNYELSALQIDSMKRTVPFAELTLRETSGKTTKLRMFRIKNGVMLPNEFGEIIDNDQDRFWCELPNGSIVKCQYFVFNPLLYGNVYFPMEIPVVKKR
jgi:hypothetical protein